MPPPGPPPLVGAPPPAPASSGPPLNLTLLARFASCAPSINSFDAHVNASWGLSQPATVGLLDHRLISIQLQDQDDLSLAWSSVSRVFNGQRILLLHWSHDFKRRDYPLAAVWMRLPGLPLPLHNPSILKVIGDSLGRYLRSDVFTAKFKNPRAARICVELDISKPPPPAFVVAIGEVQIHQRILIESQILFCSHCHLQGHNASACRNRKGKRPSVAPFQAARSGKDTCGGPLLAGTLSPGPNNSSLTLPTNAFPTCSEGVCENASVTPPCTKHALLRAESLPDPPLAPILVSGQAHLPSFQLVGPNPAPLVPPANPPAQSLPLGLPIAASPSQALSGYLSGPGQALVHPSQPLAGLTPFASSPSAPISPSSLLGPCPSPNFLAPCPPVLDQEFPPTFLSSLSSPVCSFDPMSIEQSLPPIWRSPSDLDLLPSFFSLA
ncbi:DUF4283 domain-containing protein [Cephalotus follicularis]|uniref:DUF4283 domain-containing protein n=1 Tax=Cephalotus follicularis TaxID=3775 RepID=A0A1Q3BL05_CEPFO|nr:DUF4283 domain-containing protein [Cephalotus follicularis]